MKKIVLLFPFIFIYFLFIIPDFVFAASQDFINVTGNLPEVPSLSLFQERFESIGIDADLSNSTLFYDTNGKFYLVYGNYVASRQDSNYYRVILNNNYYVDCYPGQNPSGPWRGFFALNNFSSDDPDHGYVCGALPSYDPSVFNYVSSWPGSVPFNASLPYVSSCIGYDRVVSPSFNDFGGVTGYDTYYRFGVDVSNLDYDGDYEFHVELKIAFPTSDLVLYLESLGYNPSNCTSIDIYNELKHYYTEIYDPSNYPNYHAFPVELLLDDVTVFAFNLSSDRLVGSPVHLPKYKKNATYSFIFSLSELEALYPPNYSVWGFDDDRFQDWWPLLRNFISINEFCCYATSGTDEGRLYKADLCGFYDERFLSLDEVYTKSYYLSPVGNEDTDLDSDEVKGSVIQSEKELEKDYEYQDKQEEILNDQIAEAAGVESLGGSLLGLVKNLPSFTSGIKNACMALFMPLTLLPSEIRGLFYLTIALLCAIAIIKFIRG